MDKRSEREDLVYWQLKAIYTLTSRVSENTPYGMLVNRSQDIRKLADEAMRHLDGRQLQDPEGTPRAQA